MTFFNTAGKSAPAVKFQNVGDQFDGFIAGPITARQARDFTTKQPKFYPLKPGQVEGDPIMEGVVPVRDQAGQEGTIYVTSKLMRFAIEDALRAAGVEQPAEGGRLLLQFVGHETSNGFQAKKFAARYQAPAAGAPAAQPAYDQSAYAQPAEQPAYGHGQPAF